MRTPWLTQSRTVRPRALLHLTPPTIFAFIYVVYRGFGVCDTPIVPVIRKSSTSLTYNEDFHREAVIKWSRYLDEHIKGAGMRKQMNSIKAMQVLISLYVCYFSFVIII